MKWTLLSTLFLTISVTNIYADDVENEISALMEKYDAIGVSVAVVKGKRIIYSKSFGYKIREDSIPLTNNDLFRIASISKTFVGTAIMQLLEKKKLSLDDDVNQYLGFTIRNPKFPDVPITIRMLLCHRSSINDSQGYKTFDKINPVTDSLFSKCYYEYEPNSKYAYSNLNYNLLGAIIEKVTGERFDRYIYQNILSPLKLNGSFNVLDLDSLQFVRPYFINKNGVPHYSRDAFNPYLSELQDYKLGYSTPILSPAGGMKLSAPDLAQYMMMHMNNGKNRGIRVLSRKNELLMRTPPVKKQSYALSLYRDGNIIPGEVLVGHTGGAYGFKTAMFFHPEKHYGFVVFSNGYRDSDKGSEDFRSQVIRILYKKLIENKE